VDVKEAVDLTEELARHPTKVYTKRALSKIKRIVVHTTDWTTTPQKIAEYDIEPNHISETGCPGITYHDMVGSNGQLYHTLPYEEVSWHVGMWNLGSLGIALTYRCSNKKGEDVYAPKRKLLHTLETRCGDICLKFGLTPDKVVGHRELKGTGWFMSKGSKRLRKTCPGLKVDLDIVRQNVARYMQIVLGANGFYTGSVDGLFGPQSRRAFEAYLSQEL
jgi:N-acetyl-anhydromuramyl-L-alanine amidase AmpD